MRVIIIRHTGDLSGPADTVVVNTEAEAVQIARGLREADPERLFTFDICPNPLTARDALAYVRGEAEDAAEEQREDDAAAQARRRECAECGEDFVPVDGDSFTFCAACCQHLQEGN